MGKATILVIEDEEKQRRVVGLHLASADYDVKAAGRREIRCLRRARSPL